MKRREFVKAVAATAATAAAAAMAQQTPAPAAAAPVVPPAAPPTARGRGQREAPPMAPATVPDLVATGDPHFFNHEQFATLRQMCVVMMPAFNGYPSAVDAGVPEFLDFLVGATPAERQQSYAAALAGSAPVRQVISGSIDRKKMYKSGLEQLESEARKKFSKSFSDLNPDQADALLAPAMASWELDHPPLDPFQRFVNLAHQDIRTATTNSAAWSEAAVAAGERAPGIGLYWSQVDPRIQRKT